MFKRLTQIIFIICASITLAHASLIIPLYSTEVSSPGWPIGSVKMDDTVYGLLITPHLKDLPPGMHAFRIHEMPNCSKNGKAAGVIFDPAQMRQYKGPYSGASALGILPTLYVDADRKAELPILAPRLTLQAIQGRSLIILQGGDNYLNEPQSPVASQKIACGVIGYAY